MSGRLMEEALLRWSLNGRPQPAILCSPGQEAALLTGRMLCAGHASPLVTRAGEAWRVLAGPGLPEDLALRLEALRPVESDASIARAQADRWMSELAAQEHRDGCHMALLILEEKRALGCDIGRHNALDKAVGLAAAQGWPLHRAALCLSGRVSLEILAKAAAAGIPILCTAKHVGTLCAREAQRLGIAVYQAGKTAAVYGAQGRIKEESP